LSIVSSQTKKSVALPQSTISIIISKIFIYNNADFIFDEKYFKKLIFLYKK
jgi:hypothetical protein